MTAWAKTGDSNLRIIQTPCGNTGLLRASRVWPQDRRWPVVVSTDLRRRVKTAVQFRRSSRRSPSPGPSARVWSPPFGRLLSWPSNRAGGRWSRTCKTSSLRGVNLAVFARQVRAYRGRVLHHLGQVPRGEGASRPDRCCARMWVISQNAQVLHRGPSDRLGCQTLDTLGPVEDSLYQV